MAGDGVGGVEGFGGRGEVGEGESGGCQEREGEGEE